MCVAPPFCNTNTYHNTFHKSSVFWYKNAPCGFISTGCICLHNLHCRWRNRFPSPPLGLVESVRTKGCAGSFYLVLVVLLRYREFHFFPSEACPRNVCTCRCFQIALGVCLIGMQREGNIRRKGFTCKQVYIDICDNRAQQAEKNNGCTFFMLFRLYQQGIYILLSR